MNIVVIGLGIIGGSFAKALKKYTNHNIIGINRTRSVLERAYEEKAIDEIGICVLYCNLDYVKRRGGHT